MNIFRSILFFVATLMLYLGVPLLGWGLGNLDGFFSHSVRLAYAAVVGLFSLAVGVQAYGSVEGMRGGKGEQSKFVFRQRVVRFLLVIALYITLFFIPFFDRRSIAVFALGNAIRWLGIIFSAIGYGLIFWSGVALGRQYSPEVTIQAGHRLITGSIYRYIRHPRYLGIIALGIGVSLVFRSWIGLVAILVFSGVLLFRIKDEERTMHTEFGTEWEDYCKRSWRLFPYIY